MSMVENSFYSIHLMLKIVDSDYPIPKCIGKNPQWSGDHLPCFLFGPNFNSSRAVGDTKIIGAPRNVSDRKLTRCALRKAPHYGQTQIRQGRRALSSEYREHAPS